MTAVFARFELRAAEAGRESGGAPAPWEAMRRRHRGDSATIEGAVRGNVAHWWTLDDDERERLLAGAEWLLAHKHWEAAGGLDLDDGMRAVIAAQAALLVLELGTDHYREVASIVVYPSGMVQTGQRPGPVQGTMTEARVPLHGLSAGHRGPVLVAWDQAIASARRADGHSVGPGGSAPYGRSGRGRHRRAGAPECVATIRVPPDAVRTTTSLRPSRREPSVMRLSSLSIVGSSRFLRSDTLMVASDEDTIWPQ